MIELPENTIFHDILRKEEDGYEIGLMISYNPPSKRTVLYLESEDEDDYATSRLYFPHQYVMIPYIRRNSVAGTFERYKTYMFYSLNKLDHSNFEDFKLSKVYTIPLPNYYDTFVPCLGGVYVYSSSLVGLYNDYMNKFWLAAHEWPPAIEWIEATSNNVGDKWLENYYVSTQRPTKVNDLVDKIKDFLGLTS